jgi:hypothetical protein
MSRRMLLGIAIDGSTAVLSLPSGLCRVATDRRHPPALDDLFHRHDVPPSQVKPKGNGLASTSSWKAHVGARGIAGQRWLHAALGIFHS